MIYKPDFERAKKYWRAFWEKEVLDRPPVCITALKNGAVLPAYSYTPANSFKSCINKEYDKLLTEYDTLASAVYFGGEAIPSFDITLGPDEYAGFLGAKIEAIDGHYTTWAHPVVEDWNSFNIKIDKSEGSYYDNIKKYFEYAADFAKDRFLINQLDFHSHLDAMSALRGPQNLCLDIMDYPEVIHEKLTEIDNTYRDVFNMAYKAGDMEKRGSIGWSPTYCETGKFAVIECDFSIMLSPDQAREFVIPSIEKEAAFLDRSIYHYDGKEALGHIDDILAIKDIDCVQWVPGEGQPRTIEWLDLLKKIQKAGKSLWIYDWTAEEIKNNFKELEPNKVVFSLNVGTQDEADELLEYLVNKM